MGHGGQKFDLSCILNRYAMGLINLNYQLDFLFLLKEINLLYMVVVQFVCAGYCF